MLGALSTCCGVLFSLVGAGSAGVGVVPVLLWHRLWWCYAVAWLSVNIATGSLSFLSIALSKTLRAWFKSRSAISKSLSACWWFSYALTNDFSVLIAFLRALDNSTLAMLAQAFGLGNCSMALACSSSAIWWLISAL